MSRVGYPEIDRHNPCVFTGDPRYVKVPTQGKKVQNKVIVSRIAGAHAMMRGEATIG